MKGRSRIVIFILAWLVWLALTDISDIQEVIAGAVVALIVTLIAGQWAITTQKKRPFIQRLALGIMYFFKFIWEMIKANIHVAYIVVHPLLPIKPGIVKIKTVLSNDTSVTLLANSITLTPGTLTVDVNEATKELYVHWITARSRDPEENSAKVAVRFEGLLKEVFE